MARGIISIHKTPAGHWSCPAGEDAHPDHPYSWPGGVDKELLVPALEEHCLTWHNGAAFKLVSPRWR